VHHRYVALKKAFRYAQDDRLISYNPCASIRLPKNADTQAFAPVFLTAKEVEALAAYLDTFAPPYGLLIRFAAYTGLRVAEMTRLRVRDLNLKAAHVEVHQTLQRIEGEWQVGTPKSRAPHGRYHSPRGGSSPRCESTCSPIRTALAPTLCCGRAGCWGRTSWTLTGCSTWPRSGGTTCGQRFAPS
jgi:hypothetical protein